MGKSYSIESWPREQIRSGKSVLEILMEKDIAIVAGGALGCLRSLYNTCKRLGCLDRFIPCYISNKEYALGKSDLKIIDSVNKALYEKKVSAIVIYVSCSEVLMGIDYQNIVSRVINPNNVPIHIFFRGPLCARRVNMGENARLIAALYPDARSESYGEECPVVPYPDYAGVKVVSDYYGYESILLNTGGCTGCMLSINECNKMISTRFDDVFASCGRWENLIDLIGQHTKEKTHYAIMKAAVPSILMTGVEDFSAIADKDHLHIANTDSWHTSSFGITEFVFSEVKRWAKRVNQNRREGVVLLGWPSIEISPFEFTSKYREECKSLNCNCELWNPRMNHLAKEIWVISEEGIKSAEYLNRLFSTPLKYKL